MLKKHIEKAKEEVKYASAKRELTIKFLEARAEESDNEEVKDTYSLKVGQLKKAEEEDQKWLDFLNEQ